MKNSLLVFWWLQLLFSAAQAFGSYKDDIGLTALQSELGAGTPTGAGVTFNQVEAPDASTYYAPDPGDPEFAGKSFTLKSGTSGASGHATGVARNGYGLTTGVAPGITEITAYEAGNFVGAGFLKAGNSLSAPAVETSRIQNHSWIGSSASAQEVIRRLDFVIQRDGFVAVLGLDNSGATEVPDLLAHSYNGISVGQPSGDHSHGGTRFDTAGRIKPDLVAPSAYVAVSFSVGVVSGAAALLLETADKSAGLANARANSEVIKALLMAGATKAQFPTWSRTSTRPLDPVYGAGQLNIQNSYHILTAGEQAASTSSTVSPQGWDSATSGASAARYFFDVPAGHALTNFSAMLVWNRNVYDSIAGPVFNLEATLANLDLRLYDATDFTVGNVLDSSAGTNDNVEHIFQVQLPAGRYALDVTWDLAGHDYAVAWGGTLVSSASPGQLSVSPAGGLNSTGGASGPFNPGSITYTINNSGGSSLDWTANTSQGWVTLSATGGTLPAGASTSVAVSLNSTANSLAAGSYSDTVSFVNTTTGNGNTSRSLSLTVTSTSMLPVTIVEPIFTATEFRFSFATQTGHSYVVQSSSSPTSPGWSDVKTVPGTGGMVTVTNALETSTQSFYRVITQ